MTLSDVAGLRWLVEHTPEMLTLYDASGALVYVSPSVLRTAGHAPEDLSSEVLTNLTYPDDRQHLFESFAEVYATPGAVVPMLTRQRYADGSWHWLDGTLTNLLHVASVGAVLHNFHDVTELKLAELARTEAVDMLIERNADLEHVAALVSHELRSPVTTILGLAALLQEPDVDDHTRAQCIEGLMLTATKLDDRLRYTAAFLEPRT